MTIGILIFLVVCLFLISLCVLFALRKRRIYAEFAMVGGTIKQTITQNNSVIYKECVYVCTDGNDYHRIKDAYKHQVIFYPNAKKADY